MGLNLSRLISRGLPLGLAGVMCLNAAPKLRLSNTVVGPLSIAVGENGPQQVVEAYNAGDGALNLAVSAVEDWLAPEVGAPRPCTTRQGTCIPVNIMLNTAGLERGSYTGFVEVADPDAVDAPQTIAVTVQMGGGVPDRVDFVVPPGGADSVRFETNSPLTYQVSTNNGGDWLTLAIDGAGTFDFVIPYKLTARHNNLPQGLYTGRVSITNSAFAPDIKDVPVTMRITTQPIGKLSEGEVRFRLAQETQAAQKYLVLRNAGQGALAIRNVVATVADGGDWLAAEAVPDTLLVKLTANPEGLAPGLYEATVTIETNAINSPHEARVFFTVVEQGPPIASFGGVVNNATFAAGDPIPQGGIAAIFGEQLSFEGPTEGAELPLVKELGGAKVFVNGQQVPLYFSSYGQINFQMPYETPAGEVRVQVVRGDQTGNAVSVQVTQRNPRILKFLGNYAIAVNQDGTFPVPPTPGIPSRRARPGDVLVIYAIGFGQTQPPVASGEAAPADPLAWVRPLPTVYFGRGLLPVPATPLFVGLTPTFVGLYQINVQIPPNAPKGDHVPLQIEGPGYKSNQVEIAIE